MVGAGSGEGWRNLLPAKGRAGLTNSPGVNSSGKVKIPANQLLFGQRKAKQWPWLISPGIGQAGWLFWHIRKPTWTGAELGDLYLCQHGFRMIPAPDTLCPAGQNFPFALCALNSPISLTLISIPLLFSIYAPISRSVLSVCHRLYLFLCGGGSFGFSPSGLVKELTSHWLIGSFKC